MVTGFLIQLRLNGANRLCLKALGAFADLELYELVLLEGTEAVALNLGVVDENVSRSVGRSDEAEALLWVEPLNSALCHMSYLY